MLHGYGSNKDDLFSLSRALPQNLLMVSAEAPIAMGNNAFAWYSIHFDEAGIKKYNFPQALEAINSISEFISEIQEEYGISAKKTILMGFSQGSILSIATSLTHPQKVQKVIGLSGFSDEHIIPKDLNPSDIANHDFFISHGTEDLVLPIHLGRATNEFLSKAGIKHQYQEYPEVHTISQKNLKDAVKWIEERI
jgi:phospholipase/carboxylesterase